MKRHMGFLRTLPLTHSSAALTCCHTQETPRPIFALLFFPRPSWKCSRLDCPRVPGSQRRNSLEQNTALRFSYSRNKHIPKSYWTWNRDEPTNIFWNNRRIVMTFCNIIGLQVLSFLFFFPCLLFFFLLELPPSSCVTDTQIKKGIYFSWEWMCTSPWGRMTRTPVTQSPKGVS